MTLIPTGRSCHQQHVREERWFSWDFTDSDLGSVISRNVGRSRWPARTDPSPQLKQPLLRSLLNFQRHEAVTGDLAWQIINVEGTSFGSLANSKHTESNDTAAISRAFFFLLHVLAEASFSIWTAIRSRGLAVVTTQELR